MNKYIDAEHFDARMREAMGMAMDDLSMEYQEAVQAILAMLKTEPAADVQEVVRCKDCKYSEEFIYPEGLETMVCWEDNADREVNKNGFCEKGERKDG